MKLVDDFLKSYSFQQLREMAYGGKFAHFIIQVHYEEGMRPHFHFINKQAKKNQPKEGCIHLTKVEYFKHSGKTATLNHTEREELMKHLQSLEPSLCITYYEYLCKL